MRHFIGLATAAVLLTATVAAAQQSTSQGNSTPASQQGSPSKGGWANADLPNLKKNGAGNGQSPATADDTNQGNTQTNQ